MASPLEEIKDFTVGQLAALVRNIGGPSNVEAINRHGNISDAIARVLTSADPNPQYQYHLRVAYSMPLKIKIEIGQYDWFEAEINEEHFPLRDSGTVEVLFELVHFGRSMSTDDALKDLDQRGFRPATIDELLAFGADPSTRDLQRKIDIVALGSFWQDDGRRICPYLAHAHTRRTLNLNNWFTNDWVGSCRFLVVRKPGIVS